MAQKPTPRQKLKHLILLLLAHVSFLLLLYLYAVRFEPRLALPPLATTLVNRIGVPFGILFPILYLIFVRPLPKDPLRYGAPPAWRTFVHFMILQAGCLVVPELLHLFRRIVTSTLKTPEARLPIASGDPLTLFLLLLFYPVMAEWIGRKLTLERLNFMGDKRALLYSALFYALVIGAFRGFEAFVYAFLLGCVWAYVMLDTGQLIFPIALHAINNAYIYYAVPYLRGSSIGSLWYIFVLLGLLPIGAGYIFWQYDLERRLN